jgi:Uncharacterised nucleotidyltransferase/Transglutaminase-like superfamily
MLPGEGIHSPEFDLVLACVRWPIEPADAARVRQLAQGELAQRPLHWPHLLKIVHHHQVISLAYRNLQAYAADLVPPEAAAALKASAVENARICFQRISELVCITRLFNEKQIDFRVLKGAPLALAAFGDATLRDAGDIDLLIDEAEIDQADRILRSAGYLRSEPQGRLTPRRMRSYTAHQKDFGYDHPNNGTPVDLHWRLFRNPKLPANTRLGEAGEAWTQLGRERIPTLPPEGLFLYLCVHGALDGWLRLKWLADIGALLRTASPQEIRSIAEAAAAQQVLPEFSAALILCQQRLGFHQIPPECLGPGDPTVARILRLANRLMTSNDYCPVREEIPTTVWFRNEFFLRPSLGYRVELILRSLFRPRMWQKVDLPDAIFPLYALLSPFEWLTFRIQRFTSSPGRLGRRRSVGPVTERRRSLFTRFFSLGASEAAMLIEAGGMLTFFYVALKFLPMQRLTAWMGGTKPVQRALEDSQARATLRRVEWAIGVVVRHAPLNYVCFPQSLTAYFMLRRRSIPSKLFYGVARHEQQLKTHTWIKVGDRTVVGGEAASGFTVLAVFP